MFEQYNLYLDKIISHNKDGLDKFGKTNSEVCTHLGNCFNGMIDYQFDSMHFPMSKDIAYLFLKSVDFRMADSFFALSRCQSDRFKLYDVEYEKKRLNIMREHGQVSEKDYNTLMKKFNGSSCVYVDNGNIEIMMHRNIGDIYAIVHEMFHYNFLRNNFNPKNKDAFNAIGEIYSIGAEVLLHDYICENFPSCKNDSIIRIYNRFDDLCFRSILSLYEFILIDLYKRYGKVNENLFNMELLKHKGELSYRIIDKVKGAFNEHVIDDELFLTYRYSNGAMVSGYLHENFDKNQMMYILDRLGRNICEEDVLKYFKEGNYFRDKNFHIDREKFRKIKEGFASYKEKLDNDMLLVMKK